MRLTRRWFSSRTGKLAGDGVWRFVGFGLRCLDVAMCLVKETGYAAGRAQLLRSLSI